MDKIESYTTQPGFFKSSKKKKEERIKPGSGKFSRSVEAVLKKQTSNDEFYGDESGHTLEEMLDTICTIGEKLKRAPTYENIKSYKKAVKDFLKYVIANMLNVEEHVSGINILKRKRFTMINIIDEKLESLTMEILKNQNQQINILSRVDEINGLLVDLTR